jgi:hypothetical protein
LPSELSDGKGIHFFASDITLHPVPRYRVKLSLVAQTPPLNQNWLPAAYQILSRWINVLGPVSFLCLELWMPNEAGAR